MNPDEYQVMRSAEEWHWWYRGLRSLLSRRLSCAVTGPVGHILDAGCGTGANLRLFRHHFHRARLTGVDLSSAALELIPPADNQHLILGDLNHLPLPDASVDLVFAGNVLSHRAVSPPHALGHFLRVLRPGGVLLLNVPAFDCLRGEHDEAVHDTRRFLPREIGRLLAGAGFEQADCRFWNSLLFPAAWLRRLASRSSGRHGPLARSDLPPGPGLLNGPLSLWLGWETSLASRLYLPFGTSLFASAYKPLADKN